MMVYNPLEYIVKICLALLAVLLLAGFPSKHLRSYFSKVLFVTVNAIIPVLLFASGCFVESVLSWGLTGQSASLGAVLSGMMSFGPLSYVMTFGLLPGTLSVQLPLLGTTKKQMMVLSSAGGFVGATLGDIITQCFWPPGLSLAMRVAGYSFTSSVICNVLGSSLVGFFVGANIHRTLTKIKTRRRKIKYSLMRASLKGPVAALLIPVFFIALGVYVLFFYRVPVEMMLEAKCGEACHYSFVPKSLGRLAASPFEEFVKVIAGGIPVSKKIQQGFFMEATCIIHDAEGQLHIGNDQELRIEKRHWVWIDGLAVDVSIVGNDLKMLGRARNVIVSGQAFTKTPWESIDSSVRGAVVGGIFVLVAACVPVWFWLRKERPVKPKRKNSQGNP